MKENIEKIKAAIRKNKEELATLQELEFWLEEYKSMADAGIDWSEAEEAHHAMLSEEAKKYGVEV